MFSVSRFRPVSLNFARSFAAQAQQDVVVIGGGPGGYVAAIKAAQLGLKVTCVESRGTLGGTCLNVGCIPSKALLNASHKYHEATHDFAKYGINATNVTFDLNKMMAQKSKAVGGLTSGIEGLFKKNKVTYVKGTGSFGKPTNGIHEVQVKGLDGSTSQITSKNVVIASGSEAVELPFLKFDEKRIVSSTGALSLSAVPKRLVLVGGGVVGLELGSVWSRLGAKVTVVEFQDQIAFPCDKEVSKEFQKLLTKQGLEFHLQRKVVKADVGSDAIKLHTEGSPSTFDADVVLVSVGRRPNTASLALNNAGVKLDNKGRVEIDDHFRTNVAGVYAIGDVVRGAMLAHKAEEEGVAVAEFIANGGGHVNYDAIPSVIYTHPEVSWVGKSEEELKAGLRLTPICFR